MNAQQLTPIVAENKEKIDKLIQWKDGNGARGAEARLQALEDQEDEMSCRTGQRLDKHIGFHRKKEDEGVDTERWEIEMKKMQRNNMIGIVAVIATIVVSFIFGG